MADQSMLSLFENDANFLDELTAGGGGAMAQATQGIGQAESGMMAPGMESGLSGVGMQNPMAQQMTPQQQTPPQYQQIAGMPQAAAKLQHYSNQYDQFAAQKYPGMPDASSGSISQGNSMMSSSPQQQHQFGSPPPGGARMQSPGPNYQGYRMHGSNQVTPPQQQQPQMGMSPQAMWPQAAGMPAGANMAARTQFMQQNPRSQLSQYIQQHEYNQPSPQQYPNQQASQMYAPSPIGSPPPTQRLSHMPMSSSSGLGHPTGTSRYPVMSQAGVMPMQGAHSMHSYNASTNTAAVRPGLHQGAPMQQATLNSGIQMNNSRMTQYQGYSAQMQQQQSLRPSSVMAAAAQNISNGPVSPYQPQNSTQSTYHQPYPGIGPQGPNASPRPTPSPQSQATSQYMSGSTGPQATQGFSAQSNIRQQYMPTVSAMNSTGMPPTAMGSSRMQYGMDYPPNVVSTSARQISPSSTGAGKFGFGGTMTQAGGMNTGGLLVNTTSAISSNTISQPSPSLASPHDIELEIQQLQGQVQQLYNMPQTPETQQKMLDLQERARSLRAQQQKQLLIQQRTQQQVAPTQQPPVRSMLSPKATGPRPLTLTPPQTVRQPTPNQITPSPPQPILPQPQLGSEATSAPQSQPVLAMPPVSSISPGSVTSQPQLAATQVSPASSEGPSSLAQPDLHLQSLTSSPEQPDFTAEPITPPLSDSLLLTDSLSQMPNTDYGINTPTAQSPEPEDSEKLFRAQQNQEKAQKIVDEAIAKAKLEGREIPPISALTEEEVKEKPKEVKKRKRPKKKVDKEKSDKQKEDGTSPEKPPKEKKKREPRKRKPKKDTPTKKEGELETPKDEGELPVEEGGAPKEKKPKPEKEKKPKTPSRPKSAKKKKLPPATILKKFKKRKRNDDSGGSDVEINVAPSPPEDDGILKRRSGRNTKRKKYLDDIDLNLSGDENHDNKGEAAPVLQPVQFFVENPSEEEAQIVEKILGVRMFKRKYKKIVEHPPEKEMEADVDVEVVTQDEKKATEAEVKPDEKMDVETEEAKKDDAPSSMDVTPETNGDEKMEKATSDEGEVTATEEKKEMENKDEAVSSDPVTKETKTDVTEVPKPEPEEEFEEVEVEEFYVKYKNFSYLHCEWRTAEELEYGDKRVQGKIKRYKQKRAQQNFFLTLDEDELFNPDYMEVDRVLAMSTSTDPVTSEEVTHYLVKWCCLPYEDSTWELAQDVNKKKVEEFLRFRKLPSEEEMEYKARPKSSEWNKLEESRKYKNGNRLREYQLEGINWLTFCYYNQQNCILADEMGLGKTIQSITFVQEVVNYGIRGPFLIIVPLSTIANWQREFEQWTDLNAIVYHGSSASRNMIQEYEMYYKDEKGHRIPDVYRFNALITTYEIILSDVELMSQIDWRLTIIDEAHRLKNKNCKLAEGLRLLDIEHRVLLTGTPLQNNVEELFNLLNFLEPNRFNSTAAFMEEFGDLKTEGQVDKIKALLKPMMLRRLKEDVEKNLAPKEETIIEVELTNIQKKYYRAILERNFSFLAKGTGSSNNVPNLMNTVMELRKCCNHPYLVTGAEEKIIEETRVQMHQELHEHLFQVMVQSSGKMVLLDKLLPKLKSGGHKVLIFSQMIRVLDILEDYLIHKHYLYERLDGRIRGNVRQEAIDRFSKPDSDRFVFLLCTRAGGLGINLTAADTVIIYDSDWNPQNDLQAQARCHRIGQEKMVKVYRLITRNSYEREMFDRASLKLGLDKAVLQSMGAKENANAQQQLTKKEIEDLLKKGAYGALMEEDNAGDQFCEEDIDQILQRRTQVIQIESEGKGSTFAKASFSMTSNRSDIDISDPNFWQMWAKKADLDVDYLTNRNELIIEQPRVRKQTARFGGQDSVLEMSELESSDSDEDGKGGRRKGGRRRKNKDDDTEADEDTTGMYTRSECFKVEKHLLVYGWGRWQDILLHGRFKRPLEKKDVETLAKATLLYSLQHYHGDERIKGFIWDLVTPSEDGQEKDYTNHSGLSAPVPRGRKGKKRPKEQKTGVEWDMSKCEIDPNEILHDEGYKKHLKRHANKVLLRVRLLYYLKQEVIGAEAEKVFMETPLSDIDIPAPCPDGDPPVYWWDEEADKSLLIGVFKHGYEKYNIMRQDPALSFLSRCGPPDGAALLKEQNDEENDRDDDEEPTPRRRRGRKHLDDDENFEVDSPVSVPSKASLMIPTEQAENGKLPFPGPSELNTRLRRVITGYQRNHKKEQLKNQQKAKRMERREKIEAAIKEREMQRREQQQSRWSRREECDFYRVVSTFGVERDRKTREYKWETFRNIARLDKKYDDTLTAYFHAFYHMCKRVCRKFKDEKEAIPPNNMYVEPITEERANRCLARVDLLNKIREEILWHPKLRDHLKLCQPSFDMPDWWQPGDHDLDLLIGAAKHGLARTDYHILNDPKLCFKDIVKAKTEEWNSMYAGLHSQRQGPPPGYVQDHHSRLKPELMDDDAVEPGEIVKESPKKTESLVKSEKSGTPVKAEIKTEKEEKIDGPSQEIKVTPSVSPVKEESVKSESKDKEPVLNGESSGEGEKTEEGTEEKMEVTKETEDNAEVKEQEMKDSEAEKEGATDVKTEADSDKKPDIKTEDEEKEKVETDAVKEEVKEEMGEGSPHKVKADKQSSEELKQEAPSVVGTPAKVDEEKFQAKFERAMYPTPMTDTFMEPEPGEITAADIMARAMNNPSVQWPKDRVIFHRLENVCYCVENGEWPFPRRQLPQFHMFGRPDHMTDSPTSTPLDTPGGTPKPELPGSERADTPDSGLERIGIKVKSIARLSRHADTTDDDDECTRLRITEGDGLKMTFHKKRGRKRKKDLELERGRISELVSMTSDCDSESNLSGLHSEMDSSVPNGSATPVRASPMPRMMPQLTEEEAERQMQVNQVMSAVPSIMGMLPKKRRGRKRKIDKLLEEQAAAAAALAASQGLPTPPMLVPEFQRPPVLPPEFNPDVRVPVVNIEDGTRLSGDEAPRRSELASFLEKHPGFMVEKTEMDDELEPGMIDRRRKRRPRVDPYKLDLDNLTGNENVSVINRETGKKITGAKAPPLKYLRQWLEKNRGFDVDPKWAHVVKAKGNLPSEMLKTRVPEPHERRGRRSMGSSSAGLMPSMMSDFPFSAANLAAFPGLAGSAMMAGFPKMPFPMPFGGLSGLNLGSMCGLAGYNMLSGGGAVPGKSDDAAKEGESKSDEEASPSKKKGASTSSTSSSTATSTSSAPTAPHPSFPFLYNPMLFNPLFAQSMGNFTLPSSIPTSFATLAQAGSGGLANGVEESDAEKPISDTEQDQAQDLSIKKKSSSHTSGSSKDKHQKRTGSAEKRSGPADYDDISDEPINLSAKPANSKDKSPSSSKEGKKSKPEKS